MQRVGFVRFENGFYRNAVYIWGLVENDVELFENPLWILTKFPKNQLRMKYSRIDSVNLDLPKTKFELSKLELIK